MQSAVLIDSPYFLYYDFYSLSLLRVPGIQAPGINLKRKERKKKKKHFVGSTRRETLYRKLLPDLYLLSLSFYGKS